MTAADLASDRLDSADLAALLHVSRKKARRLMGDTIPGYFDGKQWTVARRDVDAHLAANTTADPRLKRRKGLASQPS